MGSRLFGCGWNRTLGGRCRPLSAFLSFLIWLLAAMAALALSQYVLHPALSVALSDRKLDLAVDAASNLGERLARFARFTAQPA